MTFPANRSGSVLFLFMIIICLPLYSSDTIVNDRGERVGNSETWAWGSASADFLTFGSNNISSTATLFNAWLANIPQLLLSFAYLNINTICTSIAGAEEWNSLAKSRKHLRVTNPVGEQRSTYFLQLPYRWSLPLVVVGGLLHWTLSQTFFLVRIDFLDRRGALTTDSKSACGFSSLSLMIFVAVGLLVLAVIGVIGFWKMPMRMPIAGSCSLAISAACHPPPEDVDPQLKSVMWGVVKARAGEENRHCSLSSGQVTVPREGEIYY
jgi:hypothetical protein